MMLTYICEFVVKTGNMFFIFFFCILLYYCDGTNQEHIFTLIQLLIKLMLQIYLLGIIKPHKDSRTVNNENLVFFFFYSYYYYYYLY